MNIKQLLVYCGGLVNLEVALYALKYVVLFCFYTLARLYALYRSSANFSPKVVGPALY